MKSEAIYLVEATLEPNSSENGQELAVSMAKEAKVSNNEFLRAYTLWSLAEGDLQTLNELISDED